MVINAPKVTKAGLPDLRSIARHHRLAKMRLYLQKPRSVEEIAKHLRVTGRAVHFLFDALQEDSVLARLGGKSNGRYVILP
jgi:predicted ArsR family transcriptional regulator